MDKSVPLNLTVLLGVTDQAGHRFFAEYRSALRICWSQTVHAGAAYTTAVTVSCVSLNGFITRGLLTRGDPMAQQQVPGAEQWAPTPFVNSAASTVIICPQPFIWELKLLLKVIGNTINPK